MSDLTTTEINFILLLSSVLANTNRQHSATMTLNAVKASQTDRKFTVRHSVFMA